MRLINNNYFYIIVTAIAVSLLAVGVSEAKHPYPCNYYRDKAEESRRIASRENAVTVQQDYHRAAARLYLDAAGKYDAEYNACVNGQDQLYPSGGGVSQEATKDIDALRGLNKAFDDGIKSLMNGPIGAIMSAIQADSEKNPDYGNLANSRDPRVYDKYKKKLDLEDTTCEDQKAFQGEKYSTWIASYNMSNNMDIMKSSKRVYFSNNTDTDMTLTIEYTDISNASNLGGRQSETYDVPAKKSILGREILSADRKSEPCFNYSVKYSAKQRVNNDDRNETTDRDTGNGIGGTGDYPGNWPGNCSQTEVTKKYRSGKSGNGRDSGVSTGDSNYRATVVNEFKDVSSPRRVYVRNITSRAWLKITLKYYDCTNASGIYDGYEETATLSAGQQFVGTTVFSDDGKRSPSFNYKVTYELIDLNPATPEKDEVCEPIKFDSYVKNDSQVCIRNLTKTRKISVQVVYSDVKNTNSIRNGSTDTQLILQNSEVCMLPIIGDTVMRGKQLIPEFSYSVTAKPADYYISEPYNQQAWNSRKY